MTTSRSTIVVTGGAGFIGSELVRQLVVGSPRPAVSSRWAIRADRAVSGPRAFPAPEPWASFWYTWVGVAFLRAYLATAKDEAFLSKDPLELQVLLDAYLLEKAVYELGYELNNRPHWLKVPLRGLLQLLVASR